MTLSSSHRRSIMTREQRKTMLREFTEGGKSAGQLALKYGVSRSYPLWLAYCQRHGRPSRARAA